MKKLKWVSNSYDKNTFLLNFFSLKEEIQVKDWESKLIQG